MKISEIRIKSQAEITEELDACKRELLNVHFQWQSGEESDTTQKRKIKKNIARLRTVLKEKELGINAHLYAKE